MDPELKTLLGALVEGQVNLADAQAKMSEALAKLSTKLEEGQARTEATVSRLAEQVTKLTQQVDKVRVDSGRTVARLDAFTQMVLRGFTDSVGTQGELRAQFENLDARVSALEKHEQT